MIHTMQLILFKDFHHFCAVAYMTNITFLIKSFLKGFKKTVVLLFTPPIMEVQFLKEKGKTLVFKLELAVNLVLMLKEIL